MQTRPRTPSIAFLGCRCESMRLLLRRFTAASSAYISRSNQTPSVPVLIVGAGPVGLVLSILLAKLGVKSLLVEKRKSFLQHPQAHFINNRTMEIFRRIGTLSMDIERLQPPVNQWKDFVYCLSLKGPIFGVVDHLQSQDITRKNSPSWVSHLSQNRLLPLLLQQAERYGVQVLDDVNSCSSMHWNMDTFSLGKVRFGQECIGIQETVSCVKAEISVVGRDCQDPMTINCAFLVGTDGASSRVRRLLNVKMEGEHALQSLISIHFISKELAQHLTNNRPGMLYFIFNTNAIGVLVAHNLPVGEFVVQIPYFPPQQCFEDFTKEVCTRIIFDLVGARLTDIEIRTIKPWAMHAQVAEHFISEHKRVFLAGDSAHCFPPAGGFGMNTGIQDAHNLAWKLAAVLNGIGPLDLLETYEEERKPIANANTALSVQNFKDAMLIPSALGLDLASARFVHQVIDKQVGSFLPRSLQKRLLEGIFSVAQSQLSPLILNSYNPLGQSRLKHVRQILEEGKSLQMQFPAEDLGFRYKSGAVFPDGSNDLEAYKSESTRTKYKPVCRPGVRLPHLFVKCLDEEFKGGESQLSTLDLITGDGLEFIVIVGPNSSGRLWSELFLCVGKRLCVGMKIVVVWPDGSKCSSYKERKSAFGWDCNKAENILHVEEVGDNWWDLCKVPPIGVILIRPDDHVGWVSLVESSLTSENEVYNAFSSILKTS